MLLFMIAVWQALIVTFSYKLVKCDSLIDNPIYLPPVGQPSDISVINEHIYFQLSGIMIVVFNLFFRVVSVYSPELHTMLSTPFYGFVEGSFFPDAPENKLMTGSSAYSLERQGRRSPRRSRRMV